MFKEKNYFSKMKYLGLFFLACWLPAFAGFTDRYEIILDTTYPKEASFENSDIGHAVSIMRGSKISLCWEEHVIIKSENDTKLLNDKNFRSDDLLKPAKSSLHVGKIRLRKYLDKLCEIFPEYEWKHTSGTFIIQIYPKESIRGRIEITTQGEKISSSNLHLLKKYLLQSCPDDELKLFFEEKPELVLVKEFELPKKLTLREFLNLICENMGSRYSNNVVWSINGFSLSQGKSIEIKTLPMDHYAIGNNKLKRRVSLKGLLKEKLEGYDVDIGSRRSNTQHVHISSKKTKRKIYISTVSYHKSEAEVNKYTKAHCRNFEMAKKNFYRKKGEIMAIRGRMVLRVSGDEKDYDEMVEVAEMIIENSSIYDFPEVLKI